MRSACSSERKPTRSCRLRPSRSTDHAITMSNCRLAASRHSRSNAGRLSRPLAPHILSDTGNTRCESIGKARCIFSFHALKWNPLSKQDCAERTEE